MPRIDNTKRILADDYEEEYREFVSKFGEVYNFAIENITNVVNGRIDYTNLRKQLIEIQVVVDADGTPTTGASFTAEDGMVGSQIIRALNTTTPTNYVTSAPFMTFTKLQSFTTDIRYQIQNIKGLVEGEQYSLLIELTPLA